MAHRIRLGPPWEVASSEGRARHVRKFGRPRTLDSAEQVWLICDSLPPGSEVSVNGTSLGTANGELFAIEITPILQPRNEVAIAVLSPGSLDHIALEIRTQVLL
jgi:hypothetical protein